MPDTFVYETGHYENYSKVKSDSVVGNILSGGRALTFKISFERKLIAVHRI